MLTKIIPAFILCSLLLEVVLGSNCGQNCSACNARPKCGCPGVKLNFPRTRQDTDYVRYRSYVSRMKEATVCGWIETNGFLNQLETVLSYATERNHNELLVYFRPVSGQSQASMVTGSVETHFTLFDNLSEFHFCVWVSSTHNKTALYLNGTRIDERDHDMEDLIEGGGTLIVAQDQDGTDARGLHELQSFTGNITNLTVWPRVLSNQEIVNVVENCDCPSDYSVALTMDRSEVYGEAYHTLANECPTL